jgi:hypothetical protein
MATRYTLSVCTDDGPEPFDSEWADIRLKRTGDAWFLSTDGADWERFAAPEADPSTVQQLVRKEFDVRY